MEHLRLAFAAAVCLQAVYWGWLFIERKVLAKCATMPSVPRWLYAVLASTGALLVVWLSRGVIHWGRIDGIGDPLSRRLVVGFFVASVILYDLFRVKSKEWTVDGKVPFYWKAKWTAYSLLLPLFVLAVLNVPVLADPVSVQLAMSVELLLNVPVIGIVVGVLALLYTVVSDLVCGIGLVVLYNQGRRPS